MREVADRAGVALSSVSRVLSGHPDVSRVMHNRVLDAVAALGYEPDLLAQSLRRGATMTVGCVVGDISNPLLAEIVLGAETSLRAAGYSMMLMNSINEPEWDTAYIRQLRQRRVDGLLLSLADDGFDGTLSALDASDIPFVFLDRESRRLKDAGAVLSDHARGMTAAAEHLLELGHRRIALVNGSVNVRPARERAAALRRACRRHEGVTVFIKSGDFGAGHGERATIELLRRPNPPTAIIAGGNQILVGVMRAVRDLHLRIPADLSLITCDDVPLTTFLQPSLATISRNPEEMGRAAARLLLDEMSGGEPERVLLPTGFRPTASCGPPPQRNRGNDQELT